MPIDRARGTLEDVMWSVRPALRGALALTLGLGGCAWDAPMSTVAPRSDLARDILHVYGIITWIAVAIALIVGITLAWVIVRFRDRPGAPRMPPQTRGHTALEIGWTIAPAIVLLVIAIPTIQVIFGTQAAPARDALEIRVLGRQWWWEFRYPKLEVVTANELHVPAGRPVALTLDGPDVIHSFWVPVLGGKRDVVPGRLNRLTFTAEVPGEYRGQCAEFCGASHANMGMRVIVDAPDAFARWVAAQKADPAEPAAALPGAGTMATVLGWLTTVDHKRIGILYGVSGFAFFLLGGLEALVIRLQLAVPNNTVVSAHAYNALFTMHGTTMIFLAIMPFNAMFFNYMVPLLIGARDVAFPRLNALSYWIFLAGGLLLNASLLAGTPPDVGWFGYANLTSKHFAPGLGVDFWILSLQILGVSSVIAAINFIVTILNMRAPGMTMMRMPVFVWMTLVVQFLIALAFPPITVGLIYLMFDRFFGTHFYDVAAGADLHLWQHLFC